MTEFLPISSSGHLVFFQSLFGFEEPPILFDVLLHLGTLLAVVVYFRTDIREIMRDIGATLRMKGQGSQGTKFFLLIVVGTLPTGLMGFLFRDWFASLFSRPKIVGIMLLITGLVLWLTRWSKEKGRDIAKMGWIDSVLIGIAQGMAIVPGISRSGATISTGLFCGLDRELSGKFSFLLSIPAILGATVLELGKMGSFRELWTFLVGATVAFAFGLLSLKFLIKVIKIGKISNFAYYCWIFGIAIIIII